MAFFLFILKVTVWGSNVRGLMKQNFMNAEQVTGDQRRAGSTEQFNEWREQEKYQNASGSSELVSFLFVLLRFSCLRVTETDVIICFIDF